MVSGDLSPLPDKDSRVRRPSPVQDNPATIEEELDRREGKGRLCMVGGRN